PERLVTGVGVLRIDVREGQPADVLGPLAGRLVDRRLLLVEHQVLGVPLGRLVEPVVPRPFRVREVDQLVRVVAVLEVVVDLGRQEVLHIVRIRLVEHRPRLDRSHPRRRHEAEPQCQPERQTHQAALHRRSPPPPPAGAHAYPPAAPTRAVRPSSAAAASARMRCRSSAYLIAKRGLKRETIGGMNMSAPIRWKPSSSTSRSAMSAWNLMGKNTQKKKLAVSETPVKSTV